MIGFENYELLLLDNGIFYLSIAKDILFLVLNLPNISSAAPCLLTGFFNATCSLEA